MASARDEPIDGIPRACDLSIEGNKRAARLFDRSNERCWATQATVLTPAADDSRTKRSHAGPRVQNSGDAV